jgi:hypothetical protein
MTVSNDLLDDRIALHGRFETDGYLFFRDVIDRDDVEPPVSTADFIGRRVIVATDGDRARLVRFPYGAASRS